MSPNPSFRICRCGEPSLDDSDWCAPCEKIEKKRVADAKKRGRAKRAAAGLCVDCGRKAEPQDVASKAKIKLCAAHRVRRDRFRTRGVTRVVTKARERIAAATGLVTWKGNAGRLRYLGRGEKGKPTTLATNAADMALLQKQLVTAERALALAYAPEQDALPRIQRNDLRAEARAKLGLMLRLGIETFVRLGGSAAALIVDED